MSAKRQEVPGDSPEAQGVINRLRDKIVEHWAAILPIIETGDVACFVWQAPAGFLRVLNLSSGREPHVVKMPAHLRKSLRGSDAVTARWVSGHREGRIFVVWGQSTLLVNWRPGTGFSFEPGSLDAEAS